MPGFDPDKINDGSTKKSSAVVKGFDPDKISNKAVGANPIIPGNDVQDSADNYNFQPKLNADNQMLRAQNQPWYEQFGKAVGNAVANSVTGIVQGVGYIPELWDDKHDYTNSWVEFFDKPGVHNPLGEIYKTHPDQTFDLGDSGWYFDWLQTLAEGAAALGTLSYGMGVGSLKLTQGLSEVFNLGNTAAKIARGGAQLLTATGSAYIEGAMSGKEIYKETYNKQFQRNLAGGMNSMDADKAAQQKAGQAASATVKMNTIVNTFLNLGETAAIFKNPEKEIQAFMKGAGKQLEGEGRAAWANRIAKLKLEDPEVAKLFNPRHGINSMLAEATKEGVEEVNTQIAEHQGRRIGNDEEKDNGVVDMIDNYVKSYAQEAFNSEGALNFLSGFVMGPAQAFLIDHLPSKFTSYDEDGNQHFMQDDNGQVKMGADGKPVYKRYLVSGKSYNERGKRDYFTSVRDALVDHVRKVDHLNLQLQGAMANNEDMRAEQIRHQLLSINAINGIQQGVSDSWKQEYRTIADMDNKQDLSETMQPKIDELSAAVEQGKQAGEDTAELEAKLTQLLTEQQSLTGKTEAMKAGYAKDTNDHAYKQRALESVAHIEHLEKVHKDIQKMYGDDSNPVAQAVADHLFNRTAQLYLHKQAIDKEEQRINSLEANGWGLLENMETAVNKWNEHVQVTSAVTAKLQADSDKLKKVFELLQAEDTAPEVRKKAVGDLEELIDRYKAVSGSNKNIVDDLQHKLELQIRKHNTSVQAARESLETGSGYEQWKQTNPDKSFKDYQDSLYNNPLSKHSKIALAQAKAEYEVQSQNLQDSLKDKNRYELYREYAKDKKAMQAKLDAEAATENAEDYRKRNEQEFVAKMKLAEVLAENARLQNNIKKLTDEANKLIEERNVLQAQVKGLQGNGLGFAKNMNAIIKAKEKIAKLTTHINSLLAQVNTLKAQQSLLTPRIEAAMAKVKQKEAAKATPAAAVQKEGPVVPEAEEPSTPEVSVTPETSPVVEQTNVVEEKPNIEQEVNDNNKINQLKSDWDKEINEPLNAVKNAKTREELTKAAEAWMEINPYDVKQVHFGITSNLLTPGSFERGKEMFINEYKDRENIRVKWINEKYEKLIADAKQGVKVSDTREGDSSAIVGEQSAEENFKDFLKAIPTAEFTAKTSILGKVENSSKVRAAIHTSPDVVYTELVKEIRAHNKSSNKLIPESWATQAYPILKAYMLDMLGPQTPTALLPAEENAPEVEPVIKEEVVDDVAPMGMFDNFESGNFPSGDAITYEDTPKAVNPGASTAGSDVKYVEQNWNGRIGMHNETDINADVQLNENGSMLRMIPGGIKVGDEVRLEIDTSEKNKFNTFTKDGKLVNYGDVPIKVIHVATGTQIDYLHTKKWLSSERNVPNVMQGQTGNRDYQMEINLAIRKLVVDAYHANPEGGGLTTTVAERSNGHLLYSSHVDPKTGKIQYVPGTAAQMLPEGLQYVVSTTTGLLNAKGNVSTADVVNRKYAMTEVTGGSLVLIPLANGRFKAEPCLTSRLTNGHVTSVIQAIEIYMAIKAGSASAEQKAVVAKVMELTKDAFDISTAVGLQGFINQYYTHTSMFTQTNTFKDDNEDKRFVLNVPVDGKTPSAGKLNSGIYAEAVLINGKLNPNFVTLLTQQLKQRRRIVNLADPTKNIRGINEKGNNPFTDITIAESGKVSSKEYKNYTDYFRNMASTAVTYVQVEHGRKIHDVFSANSQVELNVDKLLHPTTADRTITSIPTDDINAITTGEPVQETVADDDWDFGEVIQNNKIYTDKILKVDGEDITLDNLKRLANSVPAEQRDETVTPESVLLSLQQAKLSAIPEGYNPFRKCQ